MKRKEDAFTLIELLVVIAVIALIAAILFPVMTQSREKSRSGACQSNLQQVALSLESYRQDYDDTFPSSMRADIVDGKIATIGEGWAKSLQPYLKGGQALQCPSDSMASDLTGGWTAGYTDYWFNGLLVYNITESAIPFPTSTVMNGDGDGEKGKEDYYLTALESPERYAKRHLKGANYVFVDGHAKWLTPEKILPGDIHCMPQSVPTGNNSTFCLNNPKE